MRPFVLSAAALALGLLAFLLAWALRDDAVRSAPAHHASIEGVTVGDPIEAVRADGAPIDSPPSEDPGPLRRAAPGSSEQSASPATPQSPTCAVTVVDHAGTPLAGASVTSRLDECVEHTMTDAEGRCAVARPCRDQRWRLFVELEGHFHVNETPIPTDKRTITLRRTRELHGRVVDSERGAPVANARMRFLHDTCTDCEPDERQADSSGSFTFEALPVDQDLMLEADADGYASGSARMRIDPDAESAPYVMRLERTRQVELYVFDALTHAPVPGARLMPDGPTSGADGVIALEVAQSDEQPDVRVAAPGYMETRGSASAESGRRFEVPLVAGASMTGVVRYVDGTPIEGAAVSLFQDLARMAREGVSSKARLPEGPEGWDFQGELSPQLSPDATGTYVARGLAPRTFHSALVSRRGFRPIALALPSTGAPGSMSTADIVIERPTEVRLGRWTGVTRKNGAPLAAEVSWQTACREGAVTTDAAGRFSIDDVPVGPVTARVNLGDRFQPFPSSQLTTFEVVVPPEGALERDLDVVFETRATTGRVRTPEGAPLEGIWVIAQSRLPVYRVEASTDAMGAFSFDLPVFEDDHYRISARNAGIWASGGEVKAGTVEIELTLPRSVRARVRVLDANRKPLRQWDLTARRLDATKYVVQRQGHVPTADGWCEFELPEGDLALEARTPSATPEHGQLLATARARLVPGVRADVELVVESR